MTVARDLGDRRGQRRRRRRRRQLLDLILSKHVDELVGRARPLVGVGAGVAPRLDPLAARLAARPDPDRPRALGHVVGALAHAVAEIQPGSEPRDARRGRTLVQDQEDVAPAVAREAAPGLEVGLPAVAGAQLLDRGADQLALGGAARFALLVGEGPSRLGHQRPPVGRGSGSARGRAAWSLPLRTPARACHPWQGQRAARPPGSLTRRTRSTSPSTGVLHTRPALAIS